MKLRKTYTLVNNLGTKVIHTEYLDGFQYSTPNTEPIRRALEEQDDATISATRAGNEEAFLPVEERPIAPGNPPAVAMLLSFFPTAEGYYDYENLRYIYQYKDHLGNIRVSFVKEGGSLKVMDTNDYCPFGLSFMKPAGGTSQYDPLAVPYNYKFGSKELQETGFYDFGWRQYMPDIGRWMQVDPISEKNLAWTTYNYVLNNPILRIDPKGLTDYTFDRKTGEVKQVGEANDDPDRILKTNNKGEVKYNRKGEAKVAVDKIEKGILKDGQNFKKDDNIIDVGGKGQPTLAGVEDFLVKISDYVGVEFSGAHLSTENSENAKISKVYIDEYDGNTNSSSHTSIMRKGLERQGLFTNTQWHTHPTLGYSREASTSPSSADKRFKDGWSEYFRKFIILTKQEQNFGVEKIDYTKEK